MAYATHVTDPQVSARFHALRNPKCTHPRTHKKKKEERLVQEANAQCFTKARVKKKAGPRGKGPMFHEGQGKKKKRHVDSPIRAADPAFVHCMLELSFFLQDPWQRAITDTGDAARADF